MKALYNLYLSLDGCSRRMQKIEQKITKEMEKEFGEKKVGEFFQYTNFQDKLHGCASNGEFNFSYEDFVKVIKEVEKEIKFKEVLECS